MTEAAITERAAARRQRLIDLVGAGLFGVVLGSLFALTGLWAGTLATVLLALALAVRRRWLVAMVALSLAAGLVQVFSGDIAYPADVAYAVLLFTLGADERHRVRVAGLAYAVLIALAAAVSLPQLDDQPDDLRSWLFVGTVIAVVTGVITVGGWLTGYLRLLNRRSERAAVEARIDAVERRRLQDAIDSEHERARLATDMHDVVAHSWAVVAAQADGARYALRDFPEAAEQSLQVIGDTARSAIADLRTILARLRHQEVAGAAPVDDARLLAQMRASGMQLVEQQHGSPDSPLIALTAHRLLTEALTNALKHGDLEVPVEVEQDWREGYRLVVSNAVSTEGPLVDGTGHGIVGMRERATVVGGTVTSRLDGDHWRLEAHLPPLDESDQEDR